MEQERRDPVRLHARMDGALERFDRGVAGPDFDEALSTVSRAWIACGYRPGVTAYLNFFLLRDFIEKHDAAVPARFASLRSMAASFQRTDLFVRDVTDSGPRSTGGLSSAAVRELLRDVMRRHARVAIPAWMMTYFGYSLVEAVEKQLHLDEPERRLHLSYMSQAFRIMGLRCSSDREEMEAFARSVEERHAGPSPQLERHARHLLLLGEMVGAPSDPSSVLSLLPEATAAVIEPELERWRPSPLRRGAARVLGRFLVGRAVGRPRRAVPAWS